ncbi:MAG: UDP-3-O-acyl-N-acetylglucosamine deacetylase [Rickettsiales bacterium]
MIKQSVSFQTTIANKVSCSGVGLHSGKDITMTIKPAVADSGIVFKRLDVEEKKSYVPAVFDAVCETNLGTKIRNEYGVTVATVEHLMAALWGFGIDNAIIEIDGIEVPIMDGSSDPFMFMLECAGISSLKKPRKILRIVKNVEIRDGGSFAHISPNQEGDCGMLLDVEIDFDNSAIGKQKAVYDFRDINFKQTVSRARTFGFEHEIEGLRSMGLALGGSLDNAIVVGKEGVINSDGLRYSDEFVRHKALDCVGDLFLAGYRIDGKFEFIRPGHSINNKLLRALFADDTAYVIEDEGSISDMLPINGALENIYA